MKVQNLAVCLPYSQGIDVYIRRVGQEKLFLYPETFNDRTVSKIPQPLGQPRLVVLIGRVWGTFLGHMLLQNTDLCVVPECWLVHIPYSERLQRAEFAVQLIEAHISEPIQLFGAKDSKTLEVVRESERAWWSLVQGRQRAQPPEDTK